MSKSKVIFVSVQSWINYNVQKYDDIEAPDNNVPVMMGN